MLLSARSFLEKQKAAMSRPAFVDLWRVHWHGHCLEEGWKLELSAVNSPLIVDACEQIGGFVAVFSADTGVEIIATPLDVDEREAKSACCGFGAVGAGHD